MNSTERDLPEDKLRELLTWLRKRGEPDSGIRYDHRNFDGRGAWVELHGADADFIAKHFHGQGARDLADALASIRAERDAAVAALREALLTVDEHLTGIENYGGEPAVRARKGRADIDAALKAVGEVK